MFLGTLRSEGAKALVVMRAWGKFGVGVDVEVQTFI